MRQSRPPLAARLDLPVPRTEGLADRLAQTVAETRKNRRLWGLAPLDEAASLAIPATFVQLLSIALSHARVSGDETHARDLELHYLEALPSARLAQRAERDAPGSWILHDSVPWERMERLRHGIAGLFAMLAAHGIDARLALSVSDADTLMRRSATLDALYDRAYFGRLQPMFSALPHDLAAIEAEGDARGDRWAVVDQRLASAVLHELLHFDRDRDAIVPPYLDEAIAGYLGVRLLPETAYPAAGQDNAQFGFSRFTQVGQALCRAFGLGPVLRAHAGQSCWTDVMGTRLTSTIERLAWDTYRRRPAVHFHPDIQRPDRWIKLIYAGSSGHPLDFARIEDLDALDAGSLTLPAAPEMDLEIVHHALCSACLVTEQRGGRWHVSARAPARPVILDHPTATCRPDAAGDGVAHALPIDMCGLPSAAITITEVSPPALLTLARRLRRQVVSA